MTVGSPGTGIGGLFYVVAALLAPIRSLLLRCRTSRGDRGQIGRLFLLGAGVASGIFATGWLLGFALGPVASAAAIAGTKDMSQPEIRNVVRWAALFASLLMLAVVLLAVQVARVVVRKQ
jgi:hypothetical protein